MAPFFDKPISHPHTRFEQYKLNQHEAELEAKDESNTVAAFKETQKGL